MSNVNQDTKKFSPAVLSAIYGEVQERQLPANKTVVLDEKELRDLPPALEAKPWSGNVLRVNF